MTQSSLLTVRLLEPSLGFAQEWQRVSSSRTGLLPLQGIAQTIDQSASYHVRLFVFYTPVGFPWSPSSLAAYPTCQAPATFQLSFASLLPRLLYTALLCHRTHFQSLLHVQRLPCGRTDPDCFISIRLLWISPMCSLRGIYSCNPNRKCLALEFLDILHTSPRQQTPSRELAARGMVQVEVVTITDARG
ncbi:hypothetical protein KC349_g144 [Hortaea werneckii]|nr:hypothetical protein KC349_g144 [Hortaea werneckii]